MNYRLMTAIVMCYICAALFWVNTGNWILSAVIITVTSVALKIRIKVQLRPFIRLCGVLLLITFFNVRFHYMSIMTEQSPDPQQLMLTYTCEFLLFIMAFSVFVRRSEHIGPWFAVCGILAMVLLDKIDAGTNRTETLLVCLNIACAVIFWLSSDTPVRYIRSRKAIHLILVMVTVLAVCSNWANMDVLYKRYRSGLKLLFSGGVLLDKGYEEPQQRVGFTLADKKISTHKIHPDGGDQIVAQVFSEVCPKYLIGKIYDRYDYGTWHSDDAYDLLLADTRFADSDNRKIFMLDPLSVQHAGDVFEVRHLKPFDGVVFSVPDTVAISINADSLLCSNWEDILCHNTQDQNYRVYASRQKRQKAPSEEAISRLMYVPDEVCNELEDIAVALFSECRGTSEKIRALQGYWEHAEHTMDVDIPNGSEPVVFMVKNKPPAHCELYASATCMLLRMAGVPTRYATGFSVSNRQDGYWVVQNKNAHAWAQAWDAEHLRWIDVDIATQSTGSSLPDAALQKNPLSLPQRFRVARLNDGFRGVIRLVKMITLDGYRSIAGKLRWSIAVIIPVVSLTGVSLYVVYSARRKQSRRDSYFIKLKNKLRRMDRLLEKRGLARKLSETTVQFAERLARQGPCYDDRNKHIRWYRRYSKLRYSNHRHRSLDRLTED